MSLFQRGEFILSSGLNSSFRIDCDYLTDEDIETIAWMINGNLWRDFGTVEGVPTGGLRLAEAMRQYSCPGTDLLLIVDDVSTTGRSLESHRRGREAMGAVIFNRGVIPSWCMSLLLLGKDWPTFYDKR